MVTGFLGSGKTTLLKNLLNQYTGSAKIGIIQNEFAPSGIDGIDLRQSGLPFSLLEINNGSVFCVCLLGDFIKSLAAFIDEKRPDLVVLESSGLSDPIAIAQLLQLPVLRDRLYLAHIWCVIDSFNFHRTAIAETQTIHQIRVADMVILNKTDLGNEAHEHIRKKIASWNPYAEILTARFCNIPINMDTITLKLLRPVAIRVLNAESRYESCSRPENIQTLVLKTGKRISPENLNLFLETESLRSSYRLKGYVNLTNGKTWAVQASFGLINKVEIEDYHNNTEMIIMGPTVNAGDIHRRFKVLAAV
jgi:G3E family GTPase